MPSRWIYEDHVPNVAVTIIFWGKGCLPFVVESKATTMLKMLVAKLVSPEVPTAKNV